MPDRQAIPPPSQAQEFMQDAVIPSFQPNRVIFPAQVRDFNDDIKLDPYMPADLSFAGKQRKGIHEVFENCPSFSEHIRTALRGQFPLSFKTPLPREVMKAALFIRDSTPEVLLPFWEGQLAKLRSLVADCSPSQVIWDEQIHKAIAPAAGKLKTVALAQLFRHYGLGGQRWLCQFAKGFPITGELSQKSDFPISKKDAPTPIQRREVFRTAEARFRERATKSGMKDAQPLWNEAAQQVRLGWLTPPVPLQADGRPAELKLKRYNIAFRFSVDQADKLRACDDLKHSMTNLACSVLTPIKLVSWDHLAQLSHILSERKLDWGLFKADHEAAYKQLPISPDDQECAIIALRHPSSGRWYGFVTRTLVFGAVAAVLRYNVFSRAIAALVNRIFGIPMVCYFDDFAALTQLILGEKALAIFSGFCEALGIQLKPKKSFAGNKIVFLGLLGEFPCKENGFQLAISHPGKEKEVGGADHFLSRPGSAVPPLPRETHRASVFLADSFIREIRPNSAATVVYEISSSCLQREAVGPGTDDP